MTTPNFYGASEPLSTLKLYATPVAGGAAMLIGQGTTDSSGFWSINVSPLADGRYTISAVATDEAGVTTATSAIATGTAGGPLVIDTVAPRVTDLLFDRLNGRVWVTFQDGLSGLDLRTLVDARNYKLGGVAHAVPRRGPSSSPAWSPGRPPRRARSYQGRCLTRQRRYKSGPSSTAGGRSRVATTSSPRSPGPGVSAMRQATRSTASSTGMSRREMASPAATS